MKQEAIRCIDSGDDLERWKESAEPADVRKREKVLRELKEKLLSPQPDKKKIRKPKSMHCPWKEGEVCDVRGGPDRLNARLPKLKGAGSL